LDGPQETPKRGDIEADARLIATPAQALQSAAETVRARGLQPIILGALEGESREVGIMMAGIARSVFAHHEPAAPPAVLLSGGETTVTIGNGKTGRGGRNMEFLLSLAVALDGAPGIWAIAGDTDGIDGTEDAAGGFISPDSLERARSAGLDVRAVLEDHNAYTFFEKLDDLLITGPTLTNVNALRAVLIASTGTNVELWP
jgi:hydroxypyruvate reductase